jgi:hypothetical protein
MGAHRHRYRVVHLEVRASRLKYRLEQCTATLNGGGTCRHTREWGGPWDRALTNLPPITHGLPIHTHGEDRRSWWRRALGWCRPRYGPVHEWVLVAETWGGGRWRERHHECTRCPETKTRTQGIAWWELGFPHSPSR